MRGSHLPRPTSPRDRVALPPAPELGAALLDALPLIVAVVDALGRVLHVGQAVERVLGYRADELLGVRVRTLLDPRSARAVIRSTRRGLQWYGDTSPAEVRVRCRNGTWRILEVTARTLRIPGPGGVAIPTAALTCQDVTERLVAREALGRSEALLFQSQKGELLGRLSGGILHDLNNVLTAIKGNAQLLQLDLESDPVLMSSAEEINAATNRAVALTRQLLGFVRKQAPEAQLLDVNRVVANLRALLVRLLGSGVSLELSLDAHELCVRGDAGQIEQVILNLVVNARDAMPKGGTVRLGTRRVQLTAPQTGGYPRVEAGEYVEITVADTGSGIDPDTLRRIFEPYFTTKPAGSGTGIGLATVIGIVEQAGGGIEVESEVGRGSAFRILLPMMAGSDGGAAADVFEPARGGTESVLLVEDDDAVRRFTETLLRRHGYQVIATARPDEALSIALSRSDLDIVITDMDLPGVRGDVLAKHLGSVIADLRVLTISGQGLIEPDVRKPFEPQELLHAVRSVLDRPPPDRIRAESSTHA